MCQLTPKLIYIYENKVFCTFLPNFILKINMTGILWYRGILWYIYLYVNHRHQFLYNCSLAAIIVAIIAYIIAYIIAALYTSNNIARTFSGLIIQRAKDSDLSGPSIL